MQNVLIDKLVEECIGNIDGNEMIMKRISSFCTVYILSFVIAFLMNIGIISSCFHFYW